MPDDTVRQAPPVVLRLPATQATITDIARRRVQRNHPRWRWDLNDDGLRSMVKDLDPHAGTALVESRRAILEQEEEVVAEMLLDMEAIGRRNSEDMDEQ